MNPDEIDDLYAMIWDCQNRSKYLNDWELYFIDSVHEQLGATGGLSWKQVSKLNDVWERVTARE